MGNRIRTEHREAFRLGLVDEIPSEALELLLQERAEPKPGPDSTDEAKPNRHLADHPGEAE
jgi:hypothetical protein